MADLEALKAMSAFGEALSATAERTISSPTPLEFIHARFAGGLVVSYDDGKVTFAHESLGPHQVTLEEIDAKIAALESDIGGGG